MMNEKDAMFVLGMKTEETEREAQLVNLIPKVAETYHIATIAGTIALLTVIIHIRFAGLYVKMERSLCKNTYVFCI